MELSRDDVMWQWTSSNDVTVCPNIYQTYLELVGPMWIVATVATTWLFLDSTGGTSDRSLWPAGRSSGHRKRRNGAGTGRGCWHGGADAIHGVKADSVCAVPLATQSLAASLSGISGWRQHCTRQSRIRSLVCYFPFICYMFGLMFHWPVFCAFHILGQVPLCVQKPFRIAGGFQTSRVKAPYTNPKEFSLHNDNTLSYL